MDTASPLDAQAAPIESVSSGSTTRATWLARASLAWTALAGEVLAFAPIVESSSESMSSGAASSASTSGSMSLVQSEGWSVVLILLVPVVLSAIGLVARGPRARLVRLTAAGVFSVCCVLGLASIGLFYVPAAALLVLAGLATPKPV